MLSELKPSIWCSILFKAPPLQLPLCKPFLCSPPPMKRADSFPFPFAPQKGGAQKNYFVCSNNGLMTSNPICFRTWIACSVVVVDNFLPLCTMHGLFDHGLSIMVWLFIYQNEANLVDGFSNEFCKLDIVGLGGKGASVHLWIGWQFIINPCDICTKHHFIWT